MKQRDEQGSVILESTYCIFISIIVLMFLMSFGFFLYQKSIVTITTNEMAEKISCTYKLREVSDNSNVTSADISGIGKYRYLFFKENFNSKNENKAFTILDARLSKTSLAKKEGNLDVNVETVVDDIGRRHYEITVSQRYAFLLGDLLSFIGQADVQLIEEKAYVASVDVLNYVNTVKLTKYGINKVSENVAFLEMIDSAISLLNSVFDG